MALTNKRDKPSTPGQGGVSDEPEIQLLPKQKVFTSEQALDQEVGGWPTPGQSTTTDVAAAEEHCKRLGERDAKKSAKIA